MKTDGKILIFKTPQAKEDALSKHLFSRDAMNLFYPPESIQHRLLSQIIKGKTEKSKTSSASNNEE